MSAPYIPLYVDDYDAATAHLTVEEDGAYLRLIRLCWRTPGCSIPADPEWISRKLRLSMADYERIAVPVIKEFFKLTRGRLMQKRLREEWLKYQDKTRLRSEAGRKGGSAKARKNHEKTSSNATVLLKQPEPEPEGRIEGSKKPSISTRRESDEARHEGASPLRLIEGERDNERDWLIDAAQADAEMLRCRRTDPDHASELAEFITFAKARAAELRRGRLGAAA